MDCGGEVCGVVVDDIDVYFVGFVVDGGWVEGVFFCGGGKV